MDHQNNETENFTPEMTDLTSQYQVLSTQNAHLVAHVADLEARLSEADQLIRKYRAQLVREFESPSWPISRPEPASHPTAAPAAAAAAAAPAAPAAFGTGAPGQLYAMTWTAAEEQRFLDLRAAHGEDLEAIAKVMGVSEAQLVAHLMLNE